MDTKDLETQIERCRRLALQVNDVQTRLSLEALADEYEARLAGDEDGEGDGFMLRTRH